MNDDSSEGSTVAVYHLYCEDCDLDKVYDPEEPPKRDIDYWGSVEKAAEKWSAKSAAKGARDNHSQSAFRDYDEGLRHRPHLEKIPKDEYDNNE